MDRIALWAALVFAALTPGTSLAGEEEDLRHIERNAVPFRSIDPSDTDFSDFRYVKTYVGSCRVVMLGEQSHGDGATFLAKTRLVKFLHEEMGFDVLAFESGLYDCRKSWEAYRAGEEPYAAAGRGIFPIWTRSEQVRPLIDYLGAEARGLRPLELAGFDCQFTGPASRENLAEDLATFLASVRIELGEDHRALLTALGRGRPDGRPDAETLARWKKSWRQLHLSLEGPVPMYSHAPREVGWWRQLLRSIEAYVDVAWPAEAGEETTLAERFNPRDAQMAKNLLWLVRHYYQGRKIIVWAATMHIAANHGSIETMNPSLDYTGVESMGHLVKQALGYQAKIIGFTAYEGEAGTPWRPPGGPLPKPAPGSLEDLFVRAGLENAYLDLETADDGKKLDRPLVARPLGYSPMRADWTQVLDGIVFTKTMTPSTPRGVTAEERPPGADPARSDRLDLLAVVAEAWARARERLGAKNPWADKAGFLGALELWRQAARPDAEAIRKEEARLTHWWKEHAGPGLAWRMESLLAELAALRGESELARARLDRALEVYPDTAYPQPRKHSMFHHLVSRKAMLTLDEKGLDAAVQVIAAAVTSDERCHFFYHPPWPRRLAADGLAERWPQVRERIAAAFEERAKRFPDHAKAALEYAKLLREEE